MPYILTHKNRYMECVLHLCQLIKTYQDIINHDNIARCMIGCTASQLIRDTTLPISLQSIEDWLKTRYHHEQNKNQCGNNSSLDSLLGILESVYNDLVIEEHQGHNPSSNVALFDRKGKHYFNL
ncbi:unnamed protein product [Rhizopus stolonifer]